MSISRKERAKQCVNMRDGGYCGSFAEGCENRMCPILEPRKLCDDGDVVDYCPFNGSYGYHVANNGSKIINNKDEALAALRALEATGVFDLDDVIGYVESTGVILPWLNYDPHEWFVHFNGDGGEITTSTIAVSEADAINKVRYRYYGLKSEVECPPFEAICPYNIVADAVAAVRGIERRKLEESTMTEDLFGRRKLTQNEILNRLKKMRT